jgi:hypothetical protein
MGSGGLQEHNVHTIFVKISQSVEKFKRDTQKAWGFYKHTFSINKGKQAKNKL